MVECQKKVVFRTIETPFRLQLTVKKEEGRVCVSILTLLSGVKHALLILVLVDAGQGFDIVPRGHFHPHVQGNGVVWSVGEDELDVRQILAELMGGKE